MIHQPPKNMNTPRFSTLVGLIIAAAATRLIPHPPNVTPIAAMALLGGAEFSSKRAAFLVPLVALCLSDVVLGFYATAPVVYACFAFTVCLGFWVRGRRSAARIAVAAIASAVLFFVATNFAVWAAGTLYPRTGAGLAACYVAAIPFFRNLLAGNLIYSALLFGALALAESRFARLREPVAAGAAAA